MENYAISVSKDKEIHHFEVGEYLHHNGERCKYRVFKNGAFVVSFEPDMHNYLHICQNPGGLNKELLYLLADQIESHHPHGINYNVKKINP
jgi:hypothetical protein